MYGYQITDVLLASKLLHWIQPSRKLAYRTDVEKKKNKLWA